MREAQQRRTAVRNRLIFEVIAGYLNGSLLQ